MLWIHIANLFLLSANFLFSIFVWKRLPEALPIKFGWTGKPLFWTWKDHVFWFIYPVISLGITVLMYACAFLASNLKIMYFKGRRKLLKAEFKIRKEFKTLLRKNIFILALITNVYFLLRQINTYLVAKGYLKGLNPTLLPALVLTSLAVLIRLILKMKSFLKNLPPEPEEAAVRLKESSHQN